MTASKKVVALLIALLMIFGSMSVMGAAYDYDEDNPPTGTVTVRTELQKKDSQNNWIVATGDNSHVAPGDNVRVAVYVGTSFYTVDGEMLLYYDTDFFAVDYQAYPLRTSTQIEVGTAYTSCLSAYVAPDSVGAGTLRVIMRGASPSVYQLNINEPLFYINLKVADDAADGDTLGTVSVDTNDLATLLNDNATGYIEFDYGESGDTRQTVAYGYGCNLTASFTNAPEITVGNSVRFASGYDDAVYADVTGVVGDDTLTIPANIKTRSGYTFMGWTSNNADVTAPAVSDSTFEMPEAGGVVFTAQWQQNVVITFNTDGGTAISPIGQSEPYVYGGQTWDNPPADPTKTVDGYTYRFMGWSGEGINGVGALPAQFPYATQDTNTFEYTAHWEKLVTVTYDFNDGTTSNVVISGNDVYAGNTWTDSSATPKYNRNASYNAESAAAGEFSRTGYTFMGWRDQDNNLVITIPATYPNVNTTYTAEWRAVTVSVKYYFDSTEEIQAGGTADTAVIAGILADEGNLADRDTAVYNGTFTPPALTIGSLTINTWFDANGNAYTAGQSYTVNDPAGIKLAASYTETTQAANLVATFMVDGETYATVTNLKDGDTITPPADPTKEGYTFGGWEPEVDTMGNENAVYTATWIQNEYTVSYYSDEPAGAGTLIESFSVGYGETIDAPAEPTKTGYVFDGWAFTGVTSGDEFSGDAEDYTMPAENLTAIAQWVPDKFDVIFMVDGAVYEQYVDANQVAFGSQIPVPATEPTKSGYNFAGWLDEDNNITLTAYNADAGMPAEDLTFTAQWTARDYTVSYYSDTPASNDTLISAYEVTYGGTIGAANVAAEPTKEGHTFAGWSDGTNTYTSAQVAALTLPADDVNFIAQWTLNSYTLTFAPDNGEVNTVYDKDEDNGIAFGASFTDKVPADPVKTGFTFTGWIDGDNKAPADYTDGMPAKDLTFTAQWQRNNYTITYVLGNGEADIVDTFAFEASTEGAPPADPTWTGHTFKGWDAATPSTMPAQNLTINATWDVNKYDLTLVFGNGDEPSVTKVTYGETLESAPSDPVRTGYTFADWLCSKDNQVYTSAQIGAYVMPAEDVTFTAQWTKNSYTLSFIMANDGNTADVVYAVPDNGVPYEESLATYVPADPAWEGRTFLGWSTDNGVTLLQKAEIEALTMPANDVTYTAQWSINKFTVTYLVSGATYGTDYEYAKFENVPFGTAKDDAANGYIVAEPAAITGYTFSGWSQIPDTMPNEAVTITGTYTANPYTLTFKYADDVTQDVVYQAPDNGVPFGTSLAGYVPADPTRAGYDFLGWSADNGVTLLQKAEIEALTMPAGDVTYTAQWDVHKHNIIYMVYGANYGTEGAEYTTVSSVAYGTALTLLADAPDIPGYTFSGWSSIPATMPDDDVTVQGTYSANTITISYYDDDPATTGQLIGSAYQLTYDPQGTIGSNVAAEPSKAGWTFAGWTDGTNTYTSAQVAALAIPTADTTDFYALWTHNECSITYVLGNGEDNIVVSPKYYEDTIAAPADPVWADHQFRIWTDGTNNYTSAQIGEMTMPEGNLTFTAVWEYSITWQFGNGDPDQVDWYASGESVSVPADPTWTGHTFQSWSEAITTMPAENKVISAIWDVETYTITFEYTYVNVKDADKLAAPAQLSKVYQADLPTIAAASKDGYTVTDWVYYDENDNVITDGKMPAGNVTAKATQSGIPYTLSYSISGDIPAGVTAPTDNGTYYIGDSKTLEVVTAPEGYTFSGWKLNDAVVTEVTFGAGDIAVAGEWTRNDYTITYEYTYVNVKDADKLEAPAPVTKAYQADLPTVAAATKTGYTVTDWVYYDANDNVITDGKMPAGNVTAKATQSGIAYHLTYTISGEIPDGVTAPTDSNNYYIGDTVSLATVNEVSGYAFSGWKLNDAVVTEVTFGAGDIAVAGEWVRSVFTVTFMVDGEQVGTADVIAGEKLTAADFPEDPTKQYFTFAGWADGNGTPYAVDSDVEGDITLYAQWNRVPVKLVPKTGNTTTMIERGGKVETYNTDSITGFNSSTSARVRARYAPYGVTSVQQAYSDTYGNYTYTPATQDWFVYGLASGLTGTALTTSYIEVTGDGRIQIDGLKRNRVVTGTTISVYDRMGTADDETDDVLVEKFYAVLFGDVNCDGNINNSDDNEMVSELASRNWSKDGDTYVSYITKAANLNTDGTFNANDETAFVNVVARTHEINQTTGKVVAKS